MKNIFKLIFSVIIVFIALGAGESSAGEIDKAKIGIDKVEKPDKAIDIEAVKVYKLSQSDELNHLQSLEVVKDVNPGILNEENIHKDPGRLKTNLFIPYVNRYKNKDGTKPTFVKLHLINCVRLE